MKNIAATNNILRECSAVCTDSQRKHSEILQHSKSTQCDLHVYMYNYVSVNSASLDQYISLRILNLHPYQVGKWGTALAGRQRHTWFITYILQWFIVVQVKLWDPFMKRDICAHIMGICKGVIYKLRLPAPVLFERAVDVYFSRIQQKQNPNVAFLSYSFVINFIIYFVDEISLSTWQIDFTAWVKATDQWQKVTHSVSTPRRFMI